MKNFIFTLLLCFIIKASAQNSSTVSATQELPNWPVLLANLPKGQITSGILLDKVVDYSNLKNFNTTENNISGNKHFIQALSILHKAENDLKFSYIKTS